MENHATFYNINLEITTELSEFIKIFTTHQMRLHFSEEPIDMKVPYTNIALSISYQMKAGNYILRKLPMRKYADGKFTIELDTYHAYDNEFYKVLMNVFISLTGKFYVMNHKLNSKIREEYSNGRLVNRMNLSFDENVNNVYIDINYYLQLITNLETDTTLSAAERTQKLAHYEEQLSSIVDKLTMQEIQYT